jgi:hypothetical protein
MKEWTFFPIFDSLVLKCVDWQEVTAGRRGVGTTLHLLPATSGRQAVLTVGPRAMPVAWIALPASPHSAVRTTNVFSDAVIVSS